MMLFITTPVSFFYLPSRGRGVLEGGQGNRQESDANGAIVLFVGGEEKKKNRRRTDDDAGHIVTAPSRVNLYPDSY